MIDAHCHLADSRIQDDIEGLIKRAEDIGVTHFVQAGVDSKDWERQIALQSHFGDRIRIVAGIHPYRIASMTKDTLKLGLLDLEKFVATHNVGAIGEVGLDFRETYVPTTAAKSLQSDAFVIQIQFANRIKKPCVFHVVRAHDEAMRLMKLVPPKSGGLVHAFTGNPSVAERYLAQNLSLSIGTAVLNPKSDGLRQSVRMIPLDRILVESDAPDQPPPGWPEPLNSPLCLPLIIEAIARERGDSTERIIAATRTNAAKIFGIALPS